jgi:hypothetical protein
MENRDDIKRNTAVEIRNHIHNKSLKFCKK